MAKQESTAAARHAFTRRFFFDDRTWADPHAQLVTDATLINPPCQVTQNGTVIAQANGGTQNIQTGSSTPATLTFTLMCKAAQNGQTMQQDSVVNVQ